MQTPNKGFLIIAGCRTSAGLCPRAMEKAAVRVLEPSGRLTCYYFPTLVITQLRLYLTAGSGFSTFQCL